MRRTAIIHVGLEKTGTTSIQNWLDLNRHTLLSEGYLFPKSPGIKNHTQLVAACLDDAAIDNIKAYHLATSGKSPATYRKKFQDKFDTELSQSTGWSHLIISSELISSRLHKESEIDRLVALVRNHVDEIRFVIFLRNQADLALSRFSSVIRSGGRHFHGIFEDQSSNVFFKLPPGRIVDDMQEYYNFDSIISRFERISNAKVEVEIFDPTRAGFNPVTCFAALCGINPQHLPSQNHTLNEAMSAEAQYIISQLNLENPVQFPSGIRNIKYQSLIKMIEKELIGQKRRARRVEAEEFLAQFSASNERIAERYVACKALLQNSLLHFPDNVDYEDLPLQVSDKLINFAMLARSIPKRESFSSTMRRLWQSWLK